MVKHSVQVFVISCHCFFTLSIPTFCQSVQTETEPAHEAVSQQNGIQRTEHFVIYDEWRDRRIPLRITLPSGTGRFPIVIWDHCKGSDANGYSELIGHWVKNGYVCIQPFHPISNASQDTFLQVVDRARDTAFVMDWIQQKANQSDGGKLGPFIDVTRIGVGGHGVGAHTSQLLSGATIDNSYADTPKSLIDDRPLAFVFLSPVGLGANTLFGDRSWDHIKRPTLSVTATGDVTDSGEDWRWRLNMFQNAPPQNKFMLFVEDGDREFGGLANGPTVNQRHMDHVKTTTLAFWNAFLKNDSNSQRFLRSNAIAKSSNGEAQCFHARSRNRNRVTTKHVTKNSQHRNGNRSTSLSTIAKYDRDGDGKLSREEMPLQLTIAFDLLEKNRDRNISAEELEWGLNRITVSAVQEDE